MPGEEELPRFGKRDNPATQARNFEDDRSFVALDGSLRLYGKDWGPQRKLVIDRDRARCRVCDKFVAYAGAEIDHIVPRGKGGSDNMDNLRTLCKPHHRSVHGGRSPKWTTKQT
jgi:hypothetical protein